MDLWAVVPVKERDRAKERLGLVLSGEARRGLALAMLEDVLAAIAATPGLAGLLVVTVDAEAGQLARRYSARVIAQGARDGHTGAVAAAAHLLAAERVAGMLALPGDIPLVGAVEIAEILRAHRPAPSFTIAPSHDERGSNAVLVSRPDAVPLSFGDDSFFPHLRAAEERGIAPTILHLPGIALDIDTPEDLAAFARRPSVTRTRAFLAANAMLPALSAAADR